MSEFQRTAGGSPVASFAIVTADQVTVVGDGTAEHPLHAGDDVSDVDYAFVPDLPLTPRLGMVVSVTDASLDAVAPASVNSTGRPLAIGVIAEINLAVSPPRVKVQRAGLLTLTVAEWDLVNVDPGGLVVGQVYYVNETTIGQINTAFPTTSGQFVVQVGLAQDVTTLLLGRLPATPLEVP